jgi:hypothetical protein
MSSGREGQDNLVKRRRNKDSFLQGVSREDRFHPGRLQLAGLRSQRLQLELSKRWRREQDKQLRELASFPVRRCLL